MHNDVGAPHSALHQVVAYASFLERRVQPHAPNHNRGCFLRANDLMAFGRSPRLEWVRRN